MSAEVIGMELPKLVIFWMMAALIILAIWCVWTAFVGLRDKDEHGRPTPVRWEARLSFWTGRLLLTIGTVALLILSSYGLMSLVLWVFRQ